MCGEFGGTRLFLNTVVNTLGVISPLSSACTSPREDSPLSSPPSGTSSPQPSSPLAPSFSNDFGPSSPRQETSDEENDLNDKYSESDEFRPARSSRITRSNPPGSQILPNRFDNDSEESLPSRYLKVVRKNHLRRVEFFGHARADAVSNGNSYVNTDHNILELDFGDESDSDDSDYSHRSSVSSDDDFSIGPEVSNFKSFYAFFTFLTLTNIYVFYIDIYVNIYSCVYLLIYMYMYIL
jgi:hypothetical protein